MARVIDRTRQVRPVKGKQPLRYEVVIYHTERDWDQGTGSVAAKFACPGDAFLWAKGLEGSLVHTIVVRN